MGSTSINGPCYPIIKGKTCQIPSGLRSLGLLSPAHGTPLADVPDDVGGSVIPRRNVWHTSRWVERVLPQRL